MQKALLLSVFSLFSISFGATPSANDATATSTFSLSGANFSASKAIDADATTFWSSKIFSSSQNTQTLTVNYKNDFACNYIKITPRYNQGVALGFPENFSVKVSAPSNFPVFSSSFSNHINPTSGDIIIAFPMHTSSAATLSVSMTATKLRTDNNPTNYFFQIAELSLGYDPDLGSIFQFLKNDPSIGALNEIQGVATGSFTANHTNLNQADVNTHWSADIRDDSWLDDVRSPLIRAQSANGRQNIYAPSVVWNGSSSWDIYFGGWNAENDGKDKIWKTTTSDDFLSFSAHTMVFQPGTLWHLNNPSVIKTTGTERRIMATPAKDASCRYNIPWTSTSANGRTWTPAAGTQEFISMTGYPNGTSGPYPNGWPGYTLDWKTSSDINGTHAWMYENGIYWLVFSDRHWLRNLSGQPISINNYIETVTNLDTQASNLYGPFLASSTDGKNFTYMGPARNIVYTGGTTAMDAGRSVAYFDLQTSPGLITRNPQIPDGARQPLDLKKINSKYVLLTNFDPWPADPSDQLSKLRVEISENIYGFQEGYANYTSETLTHCSGWDRSMNTAGLVTDGTRLLGVLFGGGAVTTKFDHSAIFARWRQLHVEFIRESDGLAFSMSQALGPDRAQFGLDENANGMTGHFVISGSRLTSAYTSPTITIHYGDVWQFTP